MSSEQHAAADGVQPRREQEIAVFSTCPQSREVSSGEYVRSVTEVAQWSERAGCAGILLYTDNGLVDPWLVAQLIVTSTERLSPLVAVQPAYMHPYTVANMVASFGYLHDRRLHLNMVAGGFRNDLVALGDACTHDARYDRVLEYTQIVMRLLASETVSVRGSYYAVSNLALRLKLPDELRPGLLISGSSPAGAAAAREIGAVAVKYPGRADEETGRASGPAGIRVGICARPTAEEAWRAAHARFPGDRKGQIAHKLAMKVSDSHWHRQLSAMAEEDRDGEDPYWMWPFENYATFCPYLVGSYERVGLEIRRYIDLGFRTFILDIPPSEEDLRHTRVAFAQAEGA